MFPTFYLVVLIIVLIFLLIYSALERAHNINPRYEHINSGPPHNDVLPNINLSEEVIKNSLHKYDAEECRPCGFNINDMSHNSPLLTSHNELLYKQPNSNGEIRVPYGGRVILRCGDAFAKPYGGKTLPAQCVGGQNFLIKGEMREFKDVMCTTKSMPKPMRTGQPCSGGTDWLTFGNAFNDGVLSTMNACFDGINQKTSYVEHTIIAASMHHKRDVPRAKFAQGNFFADVQVDALYKRKTQTETLSRILGKDASVYVTTKNYLSRGHLVAKADQIFSGQQLATFHFTNAAPQWQSFNNGNWSRIEDGVRKLANNNNTTLLCWTGTWGVCTLPDVCGVQRELYLNVDEQNNHSIPVPKIFYRVVIDAQSRQGIALVGVNNPYLTIEEVRSGGYVVSEEVSHEINWINWERENIEKGYCYASAVPNFTAVVKDLPVDRLHTTGILGLQELSI